MIALPLLVAALSGCGNGGGAATSTAPAASPSSQGAKASAPESGRSKQGEGRSPGKGGASSEAGQAAGSGGGGSSQPGTGGEKSIEEFGAEATGSEREALLFSFHAYLEALGRRDYATACSQLAKTVQRSLEQFAPGAPGHRGCAAILPHLLAPTAAAISRAQAAGRVTRARVKGSRGFVVYHAPGAKLFQMPMVREDGEWKVGLLAGSVLVPELP
jgi:hypothetical protein